MILGSTANKVIHSRRFRISRADLNSVYSATLLALDYNLRIYKPVSVSMISLYCRRNPQPCTCQLQRPTVTQEKRRRAVFALPNWGIAFSWCNRVTYSNKAEPHQYKSLLFKAWI